MTRSGSTFSSRSAARNGGQTPTRSARRCSMLRRWPNGSATMKRWSALHSRTTGAGPSRAGHVDAERVAVLERAIDVVGSHDSTERACLLGTLALELSQGGEWERRLELADAAVSCARRLGDEATLLRVLLHTTEATRLPATLDRRLIDTEELFDIAKRLGDPVLLGIAAVREARVKIEAAAFDQVAEAMAVLDDVADLDPYVRLNRPSILAVLAHVAGDFPAALAFAEEARVVGATEGDSGAVYAATTAQVLWDMGSLGTMVPMIEATLRSHPGVTGFRGLLGVGYCEVGRFDEARTILRHEIDTDFAEHPLNPLWLVTMSVFASLCIELDERGCGQEAVRDPGSMAGPRELERRVDERLGDRVTGWLGIRCRRSRTSAARRRAGTRAGDARRRPGLRDSHPPRASPLDGRWSDAA